MSSESESECESEPNPLIWADSEFDRERHVRFVEMMYEYLPCHYQTQEINTLTLAYFALCSLDILGAMDHINKDAVAHWTLSFLAHAKNENGMIVGEFHGFHGSKSSQFPPKLDGVLIRNGSHLASTYCALAILKTIGYDLSLINFKAITKSMKILQQHDGSFMPTHIRAETDLRFVYCAVAISYMLDDWSGVDKETTKEYIRNCQSYDGGFGLHPGVESHGGGTYCAVASLRLMGFLEENILSKGTSSSVINVALLLDWLMKRQVADGGFQGRSNKASDTCYGFWVGGVLKILGGSKFIHKEALQKYLLSCQSKYGGFSKFPGDLPELYHSYYGFSAFSLLEGEAGLNSLCVELGITNRAARSG
ncbi:hypothetical protein Droror1_Dr00019961 [Drosera rotundifolia]